MDYKKLKKDFDSLSEQEQWVWAINHKDKITLGLDNDQTDFTFNDEDKTEDCTMCYFKADVGNRWGVGMLLSAVGLKYQHV